ncbi:TRAP transporter large permease [Bosea sp. NPDC055594]
MIHLIAENLAPIMFAAMIVLLLLGLPVGFTLGLTGLLFFFVGVELAPFAPEVIRLDWLLLQALPGRIFGVMSNDVLLAIPFFTFMGLILERSGMAEDLLETVGQVFGTVRGGLAYAVIFVGALLAATTGVLSAAVISMGLISLPIMLRYGYDRRLASGVIAASGTLSLIMPPSIVLIVLADQLSRPVGDMYQGAFLPALVLCGCYALWIMLMSFLKPGLAPGLPKEAIGFKEPNGSRGLWQIGLIALFSAGIGYLIVKEAGVSGSAEVTILSIFAASLVAFLAAGLNRVPAFHNPAMALLVLAAAFGFYRFSGSGGEPGAYRSLIGVLAGAQLYVFLAALLAKATPIRLFSSLAERIAFVMIPPLLLIFLVLGTIFIGVATPTEAGAMGALGAVCIAIVMRIVNGNPERFNWRILSQATYSTAQLSAFVMILLIGARVFSLTFYGINGHVWIEHSLVKLPAGETGFMIFVAVLVFLLAFFLDFFEIAFIVVPLLAPAATSLGIDLVWFGIVIATTLQTAFMHPPFGFALIFLRSVAPKEAYVDKLTSQRIEPITSGQIYFGAIPFLIIQCVVVGIVIAMPSLVTHYRGAAATVPAGNIDDLILNKKPLLETPSAGGLLINRP